MRRPPRASAWLPALIVLLLATDDAMAWTRAEHARTGEASYKHACRRAADEVAASTALSGDPRVQLRLEIACGNLDVRAKQYGQVTAIAGDYTGAPEDFFAAAGAGRIASRKNYYVLALVNSAHFHPIVTRYWRTYHQRALAYALAASRLHGSDLVEGYEAAFYECGFADHFLHDSFSAGHMGFNRPASSAGAAKAFHDEWNRRGRLVRDRRGRTWKTYGDGRLDAEANRVARQRVVETATSSASGLVMTFVLGKRSPDHELEVWRSLPFTIVAPELESAIEELLPGDRADATFEPLLAIHRPARKDSTGEAWLLGLSSIGDPGDLRIGALVGLDLAIPFVPAQTYVAVGGTLREPDAGHHLIGEGGVIVRLGLSHDGLLTHELNGGLLWIATTRAFEGAVHASYRFNVELGPYLIRIQAGPAMIFPGAELGYYLGLGGGYVFSAAGGGAM